MRDLMWWVLSATTRGGISVAQEQPPVWFGSSGSLQTTSLTQQTEQEGSQPLPEPLQTSLLSTLSQ